MRMWRNCAKMVIMERWIEVIAWAYVYLPISGCAVLCLAKLTDALVNIYDRADRPEVDRQLEYFMGEAERLMADRRRVQIEQERRAPRGDDWTSTAPLSQDRRLLGP